MHDTDIDPDMAKFIQEMLAKGSHLQRGLITQSADRLGWGEGLELGWDATGDLEAVTDEPGKELVPYEPAGAVELRNRSRVPDTLAPATSSELTFDAEVHEGLARFVDMLKSYPLTAKTPEFRVEVRNKLEEAVEALERAS